MNEEQRDELLIRLDERVDNIRKDQKSLKETLTKEGFARCQVHDDKLKKLESTMTWTKRGVLGTVLAVAGKFLYGFIMPTS
jgi:hypothetical protein